MAKFYYESVGECVSQVYEVEASSWDEAKRVAIPMMSDGDYLAECEPEAVKEDGEYSHIDADECSEYAKLSRGAWANNTSTGAEYWEEDVLTFDDAPEDYRDDDGSEFMDWQDDAE